MKLYITLAIATVLAGTVSAGKTSGSAAQQPKKKRRNRKLASFVSSVLTDIFPSSSDGVNYVKEYYAITKNDDTNFYGGVKAQGGASAGNRGLLGTAFSTSASVYSGPGVGSITLKNNNQRAGNKEAIDVPAPNPNFFLQGQCKVTAGSPTNSNGIVAHSCLYDLCLGGGGFSCINLYSGTPFVFLPPTSIGTLANGLPPAFDLFILGGTGQFYQIKGKATILTVAGRSAFNPTSNENQVGTIAQVVSLSTNIELPPAP